jgi:hypothetical protein
MVSGHQTVGGKNRLMRKTTTSLTLEPNAPSPLTDLHGSSGVNHETKHKIR